MKMAHFIEDQIEDSNKEIVLTEGSPAFPLALAYYSKGEMKVWQFSLATNKEQSFREALQDISMVWLLASSRSYAARVLEEVGFHSIGVPTRFGHILVYRYVPREAFIQ